MRIIELTGTTAADGSLSVTSDKVVCGIIQKIVLDHTDGGGIGMDGSLQQVNGSQALTLWTVSPILASDITYYPTGVPVNTSNTGIGAPASAKLYVSGKLRLTTTSAGNAKTYRVITYLTDDASGGVKDDR